MQLAVPCLTATMAARTALGAALWLLPLSIGALTGSITLPPKKVPQVSIQLLTKDAESCDSAFSGYFWIESKMLPKLGIPAELCSFDCGRLHFDDKSYALGRIAPADGEDPCKQCNGCELTQLSLQIGGRLPAELRPGDDVVAYYCPVQTECEPLPIPLFNGVAFRLAIAAALLALVYVAAGMAYGRSKGRVSAPELGLAAPLGLHPHISQWRQLAGLVRDGAAFTRAGGRISSRSASSLAVDPVAVTDSSVVVDTSQPSKKKKKAKEREKGVSRSPASSPRASKSPKDHKSKSSSRKQLQQNLLGAGDAEGVGGAAGGGIGSGFHGQLAEQKEEAVHSSMAKTVVKVASASSTA